MAAAVGSAEEALPAIQKTSPDVMLIDLGLLGMSGVDLIKKVKDKFPEIEKMTHTIFEDKESVFSAIKAGASGYILKGSTPREIIEALNNLHAGGAPMSPKIARKVIQGLKGETVNEQYLLSRREREIVREIEKGLSYKEIADRFHISHHTVHSHIKKIYEKLQAKDREGALIMARKKGFL